jgi:hypothetical protein
MRRALALAALAGLACVVPATAASGPACVVRVTNAGPSDAPGTCTTYWLGATANNSGSFYRTVTVQVATGSVAVTLHCFTPYRSWTTTHDYGAGTATYFGTWDDERCDLTVQPTSAGTNATATSTPSWVFY